MPIKHFSAFALGTVMDRDISPGMTERPKHQATHVLYNARCPVCRAEIEHYRAIAERRDLPMTFHDLNTRDLAEWGIDADAAARRLHVQQDGRILSGVDAFIALWRALPRYRWLAKIVALPGLRQGAHVIYDRVLAPWLYARHLARIKHERQT